MRMRGWDGTRGIQYDDRSLRDRTVRRNKRQQNADDRFRKRMRAVIFFAVIAVGSLVIASILQA